MLLEKNAMSPQKMISAATKSKRMMDLLRGGTGEWESRMYPIARMEDLARNPKSTKSFIQKDIRESRFARHPELMKKSSLLEKLAFKLPTMAKTVGAGSLLGAGTGALVSDDPVAGALKGGVLGAGAGFGAKKYFGNKQLFADAKSTSKLKRTKPAPKAAPKAEAKAEVKKPNSKLKRAEKPNPQANSPTAFLHSRP